MLIVNMLYKIVFVVLVISVVSSHSRSFEIDGFKYYFSDPVATNWYQALRHCTKIGMQLLDLETEAEFLKVQKYMRDHVNEFPRRAYWLSGTSLGTTGEFYWMENGAEIAYNGFIGKQPDNVGGNEFCLEIHKKAGFTFNDIRCDNVNYFICREGKYMKPRNF